MTYPTESRPSLRLWGIPPTRGRSTQGSRAPEFLSHLPLLDLFPDVYVGIVRGGRGDLVPLEDQCARLERQHKLEAPPVRRDGGTPCLPGEVVDGLTGGNVR